MPRLLASPPSGPRRTRPRSISPSLEGLERRLLLYAATGNRWAYGSRVSYSFAPDATSVGGVPSDLHQDLAARGISEAQWKNEVRRAAAVWQSVAQINLAEVGDSGTAIGASGNQQNDPRFGDIRFAGTSQAGSTLAYAYLPPPSNGGTRAGDVIFNTNVPWNIGSTYDLQTVAIHEVGHSLGLGHSSVTASAMYDTYSGTKQGLNADDMAGIRAIYGARQEDWIDASANNNYDPYHATNISSWLNSAGRVSIAGLDITSNSDTDWFYVQAPSGASGTLRVTVQSSQLSSLSPRLQVYNAALSLAGWTMAPNASTAYGATVTLTFTGVTAGTGVYIRAMGWNGASSGVNGIGAYGLQVDFSGGAPMASISPPNTTVAGQQDQGGGWLAEAFEPGRTDIRRPGLLAPAVSPGHKSPAMRGDILEFSPPSRSSRRDHLALAHTSAVVAGHEVGSPFGILSRSGDVTNPPGQFRRARASRPSPTTTQS